MKNNLFKSLVLFSTLGLTIGLASCDKEEEHKHNLVHHDQVAATCTTDGTKEYWSCDGCKKFFSDSEGKTAVEEATLKITKLGHKLVKTEAKDATCTEAGNKVYYTCERCNLLFSDAEGTTETTAEDVKVAAKGHTLTKVEAVAATCTTAGNIEYYKCTSCNLLFSDAEGKTPTTAEAVKVEATGHTLEKVEAVAATCTTAGNIEYYKCSKCNSLFKDSEGKTATTAEEVKVAATGHTLEKVEAVAATCGSAGNIEHYKCSVCNALFTDAEGKNATTAEDVKIPATGEHTASETATYDKETRSYVKLCTVCGAKVETVSAAGAKAYPYLVDDATELNAVLALEHATKNYIKLTKDIELDKLVLDGVTDVEINGAGHTIKASADANFAENGFVQITNTSGLYICNITFDANSKGLTVVANSGTSYFGYNTYFVNGKTTATDYHKAYEDLYIKANATVYLDDARPGSVFNEGKLNIDNTNPKANINYDVTMESLYNELNGVLTFEKSIKFGKPGSLSNNFLNSDAQKGTASKASAKDNCKFTGGFEWGDYVFNGESETDPESKNIFPNYAWPIL